VSAVAPNDRTGVPGKRARFVRGMRLLRHADFERVYTRGRRHFVAHMTVFYLARTEGEGLRVGFTVGRALGSAVERNRIKRRLREAVRLQCLAAGPGLDIVINPKRSVQTLDFAELVKEVEQAFEVVRKSGERLRKSTK
jgi:ribonuclease P protein component